jgi:redox-sensitive bicupin YhaK (pirin superfamily)
LDATVPVHVTLERNLNIVTELLKMNKFQTISRVYAGMPTSDGAGVKLTRMLGTPDLDMLDPFLMLDRMDNDDPDSYMAGFPNHPHRGFETVTIMQEGQMRHEDSVGNSGLLTPGDVQWMTAGRGIIHSEIPEMLEGRMSGFQLWVNLPAKHKMVAPKYQDIPADKIPSVYGDGYAVRVIRGEYKKTKGPAESLMPVRVLDITMEKHASWSVTPNKKNTHFLCIYEGSIHTGNIKGQKQEVLSPSVVIFEGEGKIQINTSDNPSNILYCEGTPLNEPVARYGPFVMNTHSEIKQAVDDYNKGTLAT